MEVLHSHFQPNCHIKMFKNTGSFGLQSVTSMSLAIGQNFFQELVLLVSFYEDDISHKDTFSADVKHSSYLGVEIMCIFLFTAKLQ